MKKNASLLSALSFSFSFVFAFARLLFFLLTCTKYTTPYLTFTGHYKGQLISTSRSSACRLPCCSPAPYSPYKHTILPSPSSSPVIAPFNCESLSNCTTTVCLTHCSLSLPCVPQLTVAYLFNSELLTLCCWCYTYSSTLRSCGEEAQVTVLLSVSLLCDCRSPREEEAEAL